MDYRKPEMLLPERPADKIQSSLDTASRPPDSRNIDFPSAGAASVGDE